MYGEWRDQFMSTQDFHLHLKALGRCVRANDMTTARAVGDSGNTTTDSMAMATTGAEGSYTSLLDSLPSCQFRNFLTVFTMYLTRTHLISELDRMAFFNDDTHVARDALHVFIAAEDLNLLMFIYAMQYFMM